MSKGVKKQIIHLTTCLCSHSPFVKRSLADTMYLIEVTNILLRVKNNDCTRYICLINFDDR